MNILILQPCESAYAVLTDLSSKLFHAMSTLNTHRVIMHMPDKSDHIPVALKKIHGLIEQYDVTHIFGFNGISLDLTLNKAHEDIQHFGWLVDYPVHHVNRLNSPIHNKVIFSANPQHAYYISSMTSSAYAGALSLGATCPETEIRFPIYQRPFDVVFIGSWMGEPEPLWEKSTDAAVKRIAGEALAHLLEDDSADVFLVLKKKFHQYGISIERNSQLMNTLIWYLDMYMRKYLRLKMMRSIVQSGLKTLVVGSGWSDHFHGDQLYFHDPVNNEFINEIYKNCKIAICLNSNNGGCERAFQALASGCSVFSFGGVPIAQLSKQHTGIHLVASGAPEKQIAAQLRQWCEQITQDLSLHPDPSLFQSSHAWSSVAEQLIGAMTQQAVTA